MKKILLVGSGGREHSIAEAIKRSPQKTLLFTFATAKNPGILEMSEDYFMTNSLNNFDDLKIFVEKIKPDFVIVGPEDPLANGMADFLLELGIKTVGPNKVNSQLESSKGFTRNLLEKYKIIGNPKFKSFEHVDGIREFLDELGGDFVVKYDALKGGKGVKVSGDHLNAKKCVEKFGRVVIEEKLIGQEFSLISLVDGVTVVDFPAVQDHKRAYDGDCGPNTGGMGTYSDANLSLPFLTEQDLKSAHEINVAVMKALEKETGFKFKGFMYGGFIVTKNGVKLIEYNIRLGDPEAMNIMPLLKSDFVDICEAMVNEKLNKKVVQFENKATVCKYVVPQGYPDKPVKGEKIFIDYEKMSKDVRIYFASVDGMRNDLKLCGSRAIGVVGIAENLEKAEKICEQAVNLITGPVFHRKDIGTKELIGKRIRQMEEVMEM